MIVEINPLPPSVSSYSLYYKKYNETVWTSYSGNPIPATQVSTTITGLDYNSLYNIKAVSKCGATDGSAAIYPTAIIVLGCPTAQQYNPIVSANSAIVYFPVTPNIAHIASIDAKLLQNNTVIATQTILGSNLSTAITNANSFTFNGLSQSTLYKVKFTINFVDGQISTSVCGETNQPPCCEVDVTTTQTSSCPPVNINVVIS